MLLVIFGYFGKSSQLIEFTSQFRSPGLEEVRQCGGCGLVVRLIGFVLVVEERDAVTLAHAHQRSAGLGVFDVEDESDGAGGGDEEGGVVRLLVFGRGADGQIDDMTGDA